MSDPVTHESLEVLKEKDSGSLGLEGSGDIEEKGASSILETSALTSQCEGLAGEPGTKNVVFGYFVGSDLGDVSGGDLSEVGLIGLL